MRRNLRGQSVVMTVAVERGGAQLVPSAALLAARGPAWLQRVKTFDFDWAARAAPLQKPPV